VEDEADVRKTLTDILRAMRYAEPLEIEGAPDGREGLDAVVRQRPDLVLLDLQMPRMDGLALLKQIREIEPRLPVIVISATQQNKMSSGGAAHWRRRVPAQAVRSAPRRDARHDVSRLDQASPVAARSRRVTIRLTAHLLRAVRTNFCIDCRRTSVMLWRRRTRQLEQPIPA
jgi:CheY-like chemotaxis protein